MLGCLLFIPTLPGLAQEEQQPSNGGSPKFEANEKKLGVRLVALGHRRLAKFEQTKEPKVVKLRTPEGEVITETIPAGSPVEVMGKEFEYLPPLVYIPERKAVDTGKMVTSPLILNACTQEQELSYRARLDILLRRQVAGEDAKMELKRYASATVSENQSNILLALINRANQKEGWKDPVIKSFDTSPQKLPGGSLLVFNATPYGLEVELPVGSGFKKYTLKPMESRRFSPNVNQKNRTKAVAHLVAKNGSKRQFYNSTLRLSSDTRAYLFAYHDPRRHASNPAGMVQFYDEVPPMPVDKNQASAN